MSKTRAGSQSQLNPQIDDILIESMMSKVCDKFMTQIEEKLNKRFDKIESKIDELSKKVGMLDGLVESTRNDVQILSNRFDEMEQQQRRNSLRFDGIKETEDDELLKIIFNIINNTMKTKCSLVDIDDVYRIGSIDKQKGSRPRTVVVKFLSHIKRNEVIRARRLLKNTGIFVNEDLTKKQYKLQLMSKKKFGVENVWTWGGRVYVNDNNSIRVVKNEREF